MAAIVKSAHQEQINGIKNEAEGYKSNTQIIGIVSAGVLASGILILIMAPHAATHNGVIALKAMGSGFVLLGAVGGAAAIYNFVNARYFTKQQETAEEIARKQRETNKGLLGV